MMSRRGGVSQNPREEARALEKALAAGGDAAGNGRRWGRLGSLRAQVGDWPGAALAYERAVREAPDDLALYQALGRARLALADLEGVRRVVDALEARFPEAAFTHLLTAHLHKTLGERSAAAAAYARALERDPDNGEALFGLVDLDPSEAGDDVAGRAAALADRENADAADRINAAFACARILDRRGRYGDAMKYFRLGNDTALDQGKRQGLVYHPDEMEAATRRVIATYPPVSLERALEPLDVGVEPIFVIGLPRSGTTLLEQILASHPRVQAGGELAAALDAERHFREQRRSAGVTGPVDVSTGPDAELLVEARERYLDALFERGLEAERVVDKMPANFRIAGFLRLLFPEAAIVHSVRDPRATCFSLYTANFGAHEPYYHDLASLAHYYGQYVRLMRHWRHTVPGTFVEVRYEALVAEPRARIAALLEAVGLEWHPGCLDFHRQRRPVFTASHAQVRQPIYATAVDHWRHYAGWLGAVAELSAP